MRRRNNVPLRILQAVGLAAVTTCLVALYLRQEKISAIDSASNRHNPHRKGVLAKSPAKSLVAAHQPSLPPLPEPWGSHHMYTRPGEYQACPSELIEGSWRSPRSMGNAALPFTLEAQREIYANQHPKDCSKAKYLLYHVQPNGIGAVFHVTGVALELALDLGRVFVEAPGSFLASSPECGGNNTLDSCYFLPFAGCKPSVEQVRAAQAVYTLEDAERHKDAAVLVANHNALMGVRGRPPKRFAARLAATPMHPEKLYYWWRAQSVAYMLRPKPETLAELARRRAKTLAGPAPAPGCISVHVRHGDKGVEAPTFEDKEYDKAAAKLMSLDPQRFTNQIFVSTEDPDTISYFANATGPDGKQRWRTGYTAGVPRKPDRSRPNLSYMAEIGYYNEMLNSLLNLDLALECTGFVGSIYSNWVRLIDELRSTLRCKADAVFTDVHDENPHQMGLNW
ncbi:hypothetical protein Agub_g15683 [Astrephomene gubernaculifera]|uniref:Fucosyltransferase n=1 Tax=Astrephomene gubernaculifera TaxID=47775 RepID=A0AAD3E3Y6_9CHLO|nr:hypothetical protein Agub_g15683 [Astrephomene gubernaculifera]